LSLPGVEGEDLETWRGETWRRHYCHPGLDPGSRSQNRDAKRVTRDAED